MKNNLRPINVVVTVLVVLSLGALALWNVSCSQAPTHLVTTPSQPPTRVPSAVTKEEKLLVELQHSDVQSAASPDECARILETQPWCNVTKSVVRIVRPEWEQLFPRAEFFLGKYDLYGGEFFVRHRNMLIIEQDGQRYTAKTFDRLLETNGIATITDENRELVAKVFALMTIPDYLEEEVVFTKWEEGSWPSSIRLNHNYALTAWTKIQGLKIQWRFLFYEGLLLGVEGFVSEHNVGDYVDVPFERLSGPSPDSLRYWRRR